MVDLDELEKLEREATPTDETRALVDAINALVETGTEEIERLRARVAELERDLDACRVEILEAQHAVGDGWFAGGVRLAEAIERKCRMLESDAAKSAAEVKRLQGPSEEPKSEIKRYDTTSVYIGCGEYIGDVEETEDGDYVLFDDHRAIVERLQKDAALGAAVREAAAELDLGPCRWEDADSDDECSVSWAERDVLRAIGRVLAGEGGFDD